MTDGVFKWSVVVLLGLLIGLHVATSAAVGTINGTVEYLAMKSRQAR